MFKHYFEGMEGISFYPIFSLFVFVIFFIAVAIWMIKSDKQYLEEMSRKPLESDESKENSFTI
jgi:cbb3-type cytochrome oxidase subunit 3